MNHYAILKQLREFATEALSLPKKGEIPKTPCSFREREWTLSSFLILSIIVLSFLFILYQSRNVTLAVHFALQVGVTTMGISLSLPSYKRLLTLRIQHAVSWLIEAKLIEKLMCSISFFYIITWLINYIPPHVMRLWYLSQGYPVALQLSRFEIDTSRFFYAGWIGEAVLLTLFLFIIHLSLRYLDQKQEKQINLNAFRLWLGQSTGWLSQLSHCAGLAPKQHLALSLEDASQNILILGAIGSGKTTRAVHPLLLQLLDQQCGGLIFNIKGDFHQAVNIFTLTSNSQSRLTILGEEAKGFNLIEGLTPEIAASFLKSSMMLSGLPQVETFWMDTANHLCRNSLSILSLLPEHYNLTELYHYIFDQEKRDAINDKTEVLSSQLTSTEQRQLTAAKYYREQIFDQFDEKIRSGVLASVSQILEPFNSPNFIDLFCQPTDVKIEDVLTGRVFLVNLPLSRWGIGGRVAYNFIKLRFFNVMQQRSTRPEWNQEKPAFFYVMNIRMS